MSVFKAFKRKIRRTDEKTGNEGITLEVPQNEYYENISARLGVVQVLLYLSLFAFVIVSFLLNTSLITYQNFYHFFKDLNASAETVDLFSAESVSYPTDAEQSFALYRQGLAVAGNNTVTVFTASGRQTVSRVLDHYRQPVALGTGKYLLVYELGGTRYSLYNFYSCVYTGTTDYPIRGAAVSDCGMYALISSSEHYDSVVSLYSERFALLNRYNKNGYVMDVDINSRGTLLSIVTSQVEGGTFSTDLEIYQPGESSYRAKTHIGESMGIRCMFVGDSNVAVLCSDEITFVSRDGTVLEDHGFQGHSIGGVSSDDEGLAIYLKSSVVSQENVVMAFDKVGKMLYNEAVSEDAEQIAFCGDSIYLMYYGGIRCIDVQRGNNYTVECETEKRVLLAISEQEVLLCSPQKAVFVRLGV